MGLLDVLRKKKVEAKAAEEESRIAKLARYRRILIRQDTPHATDADDLAALMADLGIDVDAAEVHAADLKRMESLDATAKQGEAAVGRIDGARKACNECESETRALAQRQALKQIQLNAAWDEIQQATKAGMDAQRDHNALARANAWLLGESDVKPPKPAPAVPAVVRSMAVDVTKIQEIAT